MRFAIGWVILALLASTRCAGAPGSRTTVSLDGQWQVAQGSMEAPPAIFDRSIPVPGLADMARPPFAGVGAPSPERRAFWYRRTFSVADRGAQIALLKVAKAQFGTQVWLNGEKAGEHPGCFTPGFFDVTRLLRYDTPNTLVIRVGADRGALPPGVPTNTDYEQVKWIPGIYDSVSLILAGSPFVASVQVA